MSTQADPTLEEVIEVDFEIYQPEDVDIDGIVTNLKQVLPNDIDSDAFAQLPIKLNQTSYVIKQALNDSESEEDVDSNDFIFGILTWIPLQMCHQVTTTASTSVLEKFKKWLVDFENRNASHERQSGHGSFTFSNILSQDPLGTKNSKTACLIDERFISIPPAIAPQLFTHFLNDLRASKVEMETTYDYVLCLTRVLITSFGEDVCLVNKKRGKKKSKAKVPSQSSRLENCVEVWICPEMEILYEERLASMDVPAKDGNDGDSEDGTSVSRYFVIPYAALESCVEKIKSKYGSDSTL